MTCLSWLFFSSFPDRDFPGAPVVKTVLPMQGVWVRSLVRELRSHMPHGKKQNAKQKQYCNKFNKDFKKVRIKNKKQKKKLMMFGGIRGEEVYCYCSSDFRSQQCSFYNRKGGEQFFCCYKSQKLNSDDCWLLWRNNFKSHRTVLCSSWKNWVIILFGFYFGVFLKLFILYWGITD